jgi:RNA polymerase sigma factor (sigma-70 family)
MLFILYSFVSKLNAMTQLQFNNALLEMQNKLHYYALSLTSDSEKASDLLQETMLKALTHRDKFSQNTNFKAWVYTIMKNTFINEYRRKVKAKNSLIDPKNDFNSFMGNEYPSPESSYQSGEINKSISQLTEDYRIPFTMFLEGYKYKEIADELDLPLGTVKSRIFFTRKRLEKVLTGYGMN